MARDIRHAPRGLIAPLSQPALASLRNLNDGTPITLPEDQKLRLLELGLIEEMGEDRVLRTARYTYLLEPDGTIVKIWQVGKGELIDVHPDEVLDFAQKLPV